MFAFSSYVGGQLADSPGTIFGLPVGYLLDKTSDLGIDLIDEYILDGYLKGWNPRFFIDEFRRNLNNDTI